MTESKRLSLVFACEGDQVYRLSVSRPADDLTGAKAKAAGAALVAAADAFVTPLKALTSAALVTRQVTELLEAE